tara:strand:+ start:165 stop:929 length:765 start_codon:yes stop_codon:yes gene_type:complete
MKVVKFKSNNYIGYGKLVGNKVHMFSTLPWIDEALNGEILDFNGVKLMAPGNPSKIIGLAINYPGATGSSNDMEEPLAFIKPSTSLIGNGEDIVSPFKNLNIWGECELAIIIGKRLKDASAEEAQESIYGYSVANDVTAENIQGWDHHLARSKGCDTFCALGPWIETEFKPKDQVISGYHNKELIRKGLLGERIFKEPNILVELSKWITLEAGDVILTGAPNRVRDRIFFTNGDSYKCSIDGLGEITNTFIQRR